MEIRGKKGVKRNIWPVFEIYNIKAESEDEHNEEMS